MKRLVIILLACISLSAQANQALQYTQRRISIDGDSYTVTLPKGYQLELLTAQLKKPRLLTFGKNGDLFIGSKSGRIYRLTPPYTKPTMLAKLSDYPHSVALRGDEIFVATTSGLFRAPYKQGQASIDDDFSLLAKIPGGGGHNSRSVAIGPDGRIYLSLGITSNCSDEYLHESYDFNKRRGGVMVLDESAAPPTWRTFGAGLRNPVGFAWHPQTKEMYASNNGPDHLGFEVPPEYFAHITDGSFHGMPWYQFDGNKVIRDNCIKSAPPRPINEVSAPVATFPARNAPMGVTFVPEGAMDARLQNSAVVALRGSWGTKPSGGFMGHPATRREPRLVMVQFDKGEPTGVVEDLLSGFQLADGDRWARPVGVAVGPDGTLYFTSDSGVNGLFRLRYSGGH